jgi:putative endonuclease
MGLVQSIAGVFSRFGRRHFRSPDTSENQHHLLGRRGEKLAARYLRRNGFKVLYRNFRAPRGGEVDIVCRDTTCNELVFVEVKTRSTRDYGSPASAVKREKQQLIARGALAWLRLLDNPDIIFRFDIVEVVIDADGESFNLVRAAFQLPEPHRY